MALHTTLFALAAAAFLPSAQAKAVMGFNSASTKSDGSPKMQSDFESEFKLAAGLQGAPGTFNSVRLYTNIQGGSTNSPLSAFPAAVATNTSMLLGIWTSGTNSIQNELAALGAGISKYGDAFANLVVGVAVGSEDLYRNSATGVANKAGIGAQPSVIAGFISQTKDFLKNTSLSHVPVGHVDTFDVWGNATNAAVLNAVDFLGIDVYPFYESNLGNNSIGQAKALWDDAMKQVQQSAGNKPVWITETGWPSSGKAWGMADPTVANAKQYWDEIGCPLFGVTNTWWYVLQDENPTDTADFSVSLKGATTPVWNLTCPPAKTTTSSTAAGNQSDGGLNNGGKGNSSSSSGGKSGNSGNSLAVPTALFALFPLAFAAVILF
jgi:glucan endo-1,3-beta-D-glucosidase